MGMFDYVNYWANCPNCNEEVGPDRWQTKDTNCLMEKVEPEECRHFHAICPSCGYWLEATVKKVCILKGVSIEARKL